MRKGERSDHKAGLSEPLYDKPENAVGEQIDRVIRTLEPFFCGNPEQSNNQNYVKYQLQLSCRVKHICSGNLQAETAALNQTIDTR